VLFKTLDTCTHRDKTNSILCGYVWCYFSAYTCCALVDPRRKCIGSHNRFCIIMMSSSRCVRTGFFCKKPGRRSSKTSCIWFLFLDTF